MQIKKHPGTEYERILYSYPSMLLSLMGEGSISLKPKMAENSEIVSAITEECSRLRRRDIHWTLNDQGHEWRRIHREAVEAAEKAEIAASYAAGI